MDPTRRLNLTWRTRSFLDASETFQSSLRLHSSGKPGSLVLGAGRRINCFLPYSPLRADTNRNGQHTFRHLDPTCNRLRTRVLSDCDEAFEGVAIAIREGRRQEATLCREHRRPHRRDEWFAVLDV